MKGFLGGVITAMITPFDSDGNVNFNELGKMIEHQIYGGADAIVVLGTTGEPSTMTADEKYSVIKYAVGNFKNRIKIIAGTGSNDTHRAVSLSMRAEELGVDGIIAVTPYYNRCTQQGLYLYYEAICRSVKLPVIAYSVPARTGVHILPATAAKLADLPNIAGIKEASGNMSQIIETMQYVHEKMDLYSGEDILNLPVLAIGGAGLVSVISNIAPSLVRRMYTLVKQGRLDEANEIQNFLFPLTEACFLEVNPIPIKAAYNMLGFNAGLPRAPLTELAEENKAKLQNALNKVGLNKI